EEPRSEEVRERRLHVLELAHVRDVAAALYREHEVVRHLVAPARVARRRLQGIEAAVQLDAVEALRGVAELQALRQALRVELPAPARVPPARDADANRHAATIRGSERGSRAVGASGGRATRGGAGGASAVIRRARHERHPDLVLDLADAAYRLGDRGGERLLGQRFDHAIQRHATLVHDGVDPPGFRRRIALEGLLDVALDLGIVALHGLD